MDSKQSILYFVLTLTYIGSSRSTYIGWDNQDGKNVDTKSNKLVNYPTKRYGYSFRNDKDISRYLKMFGEDMMIWRCKKAIKPEWDWKPIPMLELYCEAIGRLDRVEWYQNGHKIKLGGRYGQHIIPHYSTGRYFAKWIDFRLKIYNATSWDSGIYTFRAVSVDGSSQDSIIFVDISAPRRSRKKQNKAVKNSSRKHKNKNRRLKERRPRGRRTRNYNDETHQT